MKRLKPRQIVVLLAAVAWTALTARLGWWQLDRAAQKTSAQAALEQRRQLPALDPADLALNTERAAAQHHRRIVLQGRWLPEHSVYLENRQMEGRPGFFALAPLLLDDGTAVIVQRGWLPRDLLDRTRIVAPPPPATRVKVQGRIAPAPGRIHDFEGAASGPIRQNLELSAFERETGLKLRPLSIVQEDGDPALQDGLLRRWPAPAFDVHKHHGYAFQWFALSGLTIALYVWFHRSSAPDANAPAAAPEPLTMAVHHIPAPDLADQDLQARDRVRKGRLRMLMVLAVCAAPVVASYFTYFVIRPEARNNYGDLIAPTRGLPADLGMKTLDGRAVGPAELKGQWLLVTVGPAACDAECDKRMFMQRQLREMLGRERDRLEKVWLITDSAPLTPALRAAIDAVPPVTAMRVDAAALARWLSPQAGHRLEEHLYVVDPMGEWMMRLPAQPEPSKVKRDLDRLLKASAFWDKAGR